MGYILDLPVEGGEIKAARDGFYTGFEGISIAPDFLKTFCGCKFSHMDAIIQWKSNISTACRQ
jgi:hypothetical protein